jgi:hypothetical protein
MIAVLRLAPVRHRAARYGRALHIITESTTARRRLAEPGGGGVAIIHCR